MEDRGRARLAALGRLDGFDGLGGKQIAAIECVIAIMYGARLNMKLHKVP